MTNSEIISIGGICLALISALLGAYYKLSERISKGEAHTEVCNEKHKSHDLKFLKQDEINLQAEKNHVEIMAALSRIDTNIEYLKIK